MAAAQRRSGLGLEAFAVALGTSAARMSAYRSGQTIPSAVLYTRALRIADALAAAEQAGLMTHPMTTDVIAAALSDGNPAWAWKMLLQARNDLRWALDQHPGIVAGWHAAPRTTGSARWDTAVAAVTEHEFASAGRPVPAWTQIGPLDHDWVYGHPGLTADEVRERTPAWLRRWRIFTLAEDLVTV